MQIRLATRHGHLSEATQARVTTKAEKLLRFFDRLTEIEVIIDLKKQDSPRVDILCSAKHKHDFVSHGESDNLMASVDAAVQKIEQQLRRHKERVQQRHRQAERGRANASDAQGGLADSGSVDGVVPRTLDEKELSEGVGGWNDAES